MRFEWDQGKADANTRKHGISFEEAAGVFEDPWARIIDDPDHSYQEERFIILGLSVIGRILVVCHCLRTSGEVIRIISARKATKGEQAAYWRHRR